MTDFAGPLDSGSLPPAFISSTISGPLILSAGINWLGYSIKSQIPIMTPVIGQLWPRGVKP